MARGVQLIKLPEFEINPANHLLRTQGIDSALEGVVRARQFDQRHSLDQDQFAHRRRIDEGNLDLNRQRVGMERERLDAARTAASQPQGEDEEAIRQTLSRVAVVIDGMQGPERQQAWQRLTSNPRIARALQQYGQDPNDHVNGPRFIIAQTMDPLQVDTRRAYIDQQRRGNERDVGGAAPTERRLRLNEDGEVELDPDQPGPTAAPPAAGPTARPQPVVDQRRPAIMHQPDDTPAQYSGQLIDPQAPPAEGVPGVIINRPLSQDRAAGTRERERDTAQLQPRVSANDRNLTVGEIQRYWQSQYGRAARAGHRYDRRGQEVPLAAPGGDRGTRGAVAAGLEQSISDLADARQVINRSNYFSRQWGHMLNHGEFAEILPIIEVATASVMHGMSGAQTNIPETERWLRSFMPQPWERLGRVNNKLTRLEAMLKRIQARGGAEWTPEEQLELRNQFRRELNLPVLTMEQHLTSVGRRPQPETDPNIPPENRTRRPPGTPQSNPLESLSDDELKRRLGIQ